MYSCKRCFDWLLISDRSTLSKRNISFDLSAILERTPIYNIGYNLEGDNYKYVQSQFRVQHQVDLKLNRIFLLGTQTTTVLSREKSVSVAFMVNTIQGYHLKKSTDFSEQLESCYLIIVMKFPTFSLSA